jgi:hypothetical protein
MLGGAIKKPTADNSVIVRHTEEVVCTANGVVPLPKDHLTGKALTPKAAVDHPIRFINLTTGSRTQIVVNDGVAQAMPENKALTFKNPSLQDADKVTKEGDRIRIFWDEIITPSHETETAVEVTISPDTFPGTYRVIGDTLIRSAETGKDEAFQFVINKAKVQSNVTITLQAEGDPSTFEMTLNVLRSTNEDGEPEMMKLVRYGFTTETTSGGGNDVGGWTNPTIPNSNDG